MDRASPTVLTLDAGTMHDPCQVCATTPADSLVTQMKGPSPGLRLHALPSRYTYL